MRFALTTTLRKLQIEVDANTTTDPVKVHVSYNQWYAKDTSSSGSQNTSISTTTITDICDAPLQAMPKEIEMINVYNPDTVDHVITLYYYDNGTRYIIWKGNIASGSTYTQSSTGAGMITDDTGSAQWSAGTTGGGGGGYRYFRLNITDWSGASGTAPPTATFVKELTLRVGATTVQTADMTAASSPSPLVASADSENASHPAWHAFNNFQEIYGVGGTMPRSEYWQSGATGASHWLQIDIGAGNEVIPTAYTITLVNPTSPAPYLKAFQLLASNTGAFAGEEITLDSQTGLGLADWDMYTTSSHNRPTLFEISAHGVSGYRYFRVYIDHWVAGGTPDSEAVANPVRVNEFVIQSGGTDYPTADMTTYNAPSPYVSDSASQHNSFPNWKAFDGAADDRWIIEAGVAFPKWLQIDMGSGVTLTPNQWQIKPDSAVSLGYYITDMRLYGSVYGTFDGEETLLDTETGITGWVNSTAKTFTI